MGKMKPLVFFVCAIGILLCVQASAGDKGEPPPEYFAVETYTVKPPMVDAYEKVIKEMAAAMNAAGADSPSYFFWTSSGPSMTYTFVTPIEDFAALDAMQADWMKLPDLIGKDRLQKMWAEASRAVDHVSRYVIVKLPDLSYEPATAAVAADRPYQRYSFFYVAPEREVEFRSLVKSFVALCRDKKVAEPFQVYSVAMGDNLPLYISVSSAKNPADWIASRTRMKDTLGEEGRTLSGKIVSTLRKYERSEGWHRMGLSYVPPSMRKKK